ncbi:hypothetical protein BY458DRAFT_552523 [Sporodiniella umbellata]|nr:hypothetical protein BY458DRAFT_552523 [Sporodiniella umbellata]
MRFTGELFTYEKESNLVAFESGVPTDKTVVFIGGLGDGWNAVPYLTPLGKSLSSIGWSLTQAQLTSSFGGYGITDLATDSKQLDALVDHLTNQRGKKHIVFLGHSTGCQDSQWHNRHSNKKVLGYILQAPVSDREFLSKNADDYQSSLDLATKMRKEGKGQDLMPRSIAETPTTADRYYSLTAKGGDDDLFSTDLSDQEILSRYQNVSRPMCWVYSEKDEFYASSVPQKEAMARYKSLVPAIKKAVIVPEGDHIISKKVSQDYFISVVKDFLQELLK